MLEKFFVGEDTSENVFQREVCFNVFVLEIGLLQYLSEVQYFIVENEEEKIVPPSMFVQQLGRSRTR